MTCILAFGTLMWDNALSRFDGTRVTVPGRRRVFRGSSMRRWGSRGAPCPRLALAPGEGFEGVLFRVPPGRSRRVLRELEQREGAPPEKVEVLTPEGSVRAHLFDVPAGERSWPAGEELLDAFRTARGAVGTGVEYVRTVVHAMELWKIEDPLVSGIWSELRSR